MLRHTETRGVRVCPASFHAWRMAADLRRLLHVQWLARFVELEGRTLEVHPQLRRPDGGGIGRGSPPDSLPQAGRKGLEARRGAIGARGPGVAALILARPAGWQAAGSRITVLPHGRGLILQRLSGRRVVPSPAASLGRERLGRPRLRRVAAAPELQLRDRDTRLDGAA